MFQPFLRFYIPSVREVYTIISPCLVSTLLEILLLLAFEAGAHQAQDDVSTLLEILPLVLGGFLGF